MSAELVIASITIIALFAIMWAGSATGINDDLF